MNPATIPLEKKVDMIFHYLFDLNTAEKEEDFWNKLDQDEIRQISKIQKEPRDNFIL